MAKLKFVRDLQAAVGTAHNGDITDVIDKNMEQQYREHKQMNLEIKESIRALERDNIDIHASLNDYEKSKSVTVVNNVHLDKAAMNVN